LTTDQVDTPAEEEVLEAEVPTEAEQQETGLDPEQVRAYLASLEDPEEADRYLSALRDDIRRRTRAYQEDLRRERQSIYDRFQRDQRLRRLTEQEAEAIRQAHLEAEQQLEKVIQDDVPLSTRRSALLQYQRSLESAVEQRLMDQLYDSFRQHPAFDKLDADQIDALREVNRRSLGPWVRRWLEELTIAEARAAVEAAKAQLKQEEPKPKVRRQTPPATPGTGRTIPLSAEAIANMTDEEYERHRAAILRETGRLLRGG